MSSIDVGSWGKKIKQCQHCSALHPIYTTLTACRVCGESLKDCEIVPNPRFLGTSAVETEPVAPEPATPPPPPPPAPLPEPIEPPLPAPEPEPHKALSRLPEWKPPTPEPQEETAPLWRKLTARVGVTFILLLLGLFLGTWISMKLEPVFGLNWYEPSETAGAIAITFTPPNVFAILFAWIFGWNAKRWRNK